MDPNRTQAQATPPTQHPCVMVVEDDPRIGEALAHLLHGKGYRVDRCSDGREALAHLRAGVAPDVILLDLMMPNVNGWEFRVEQRHMPEWANIPVIVMSADDSAQASAIDAYACLKKPISPGALLDSLERLLHEREQARLEARAAELDRMNALGVLAAGLTHEINNPLAFVSGNLELAKLKCGQLEMLLPPSGQASMRDLLRLLDQAQGGAKRIADVVRGVSAFAHPDMEQVVPMNVQEVLESSLQLVSNEIRHHARLERDYNVVPSVMGNPAKLRQVFTNLLINAVHSLGDADAAQNVIRVETRLSPDNQVVISIADSGSGISADVLGRIFDPFFSTKAIGAGMGLGLSISHRLVSNMGGSITVDTAPGRGSTFYVMLQSREHVSGEHRPAIVARAASDDARPTVLIIDDESMMCDLLRSMLQDDYDVTTYSSSRKALEQLHTDVFFDVVLCDLMMPEMTGMDIYEELAERRPDQAQRFVFMTGGTFTDRASQFLEDNEGPTLTKPFRHEELRNAIEGALRKFGARNGRGKSHPYN